MYTNPHCRCCKIRDAGICTCWENEPCVECGQCLSHCRCHDAEKDRGEQGGWMWSAEDLEFDSPGGPFAGLP